MDLYPKEGWFQFLVQISHYIDQQISGSGKHSARVAEWSHSTAVELGCSEKDTQVIFWAALLHDVGKIGIPSGILTKTSPLTEDEWSWIRLHPILGSNILQAVKVQTSVAALVMAHQEKVDGSGYPFGLKGEEIPLGARILAVVDAYDAMTSDRVYRAARSHPEAVEELHQLAGQHFDAKVVQAFMEVLKFEIPRQKTIEHKARGNGRSSALGSGPACPQSGCPVSPYPIFLGGKGLLR
jgi:putative nucleotidyltransferase with HDIG domain